MQLQTVIDHLSTGELSLTNLGDNDNDGVSSNNLDKIINHVNLALIELYKQFNLSLKELYLEQYPHIQKYHLKSKHALSNTASEELKYIIDTEDDPFTNDILQILTVQDEEGCELVLNDINNSDSLFTPKYNVLQIPCPEENQHVTIIYRAAPELLKTGCDLTQEVDLPITFLEPLLYYVAYRIKSAMPSVESITESNNYYSKYTNALNLIKMQGLYSSSNVSNIKPELRGFV